MRLRKSYRRLKTCTNSFRWAAEWVSVQSRDRVLLVELWGRWEWSERC
jgi:hypothetical protein